MLILERKEGESVIIEHEGETLIVTIVQAKDGKFKLAFEGPESFEVLRQELAEE